MNRRRFLAASLRLPAAAAALPVLGGLATLAQEGEQEAAEMVSANDAGLMFPKGYEFAQEEISVVNGQFFLRVTSGDLVGETPLGMRQLLIRGVDGVLRHWSLDVPSMQLPVHPW